MFDFVRWGFYTGMRRGESSKLTFAMLDRSGEPWVLRIPDTVTKNGRGRSIGIDGQARLVLERRLEARDINSPLIFHREGRPMGPFRDLWRSALAAAGLPSDRRYHDLRRSAVKTLIQSGVPQHVAMRVSGHVTTSMFLRYSIATDSDTANALKQADTYLSNQPANKAAAPRTKALGHILGTKQRVTTDEDWCRRWDLNPH